MDEVLHFENFKTAASTVYKLTRKVQTGEKEKAIFMQFYAKKLKTGLTLSKDRYSRRSRKIWVQFMK